MNQLFAQVVKGKSGEIEYLKKLPEKALNTTDHTRDVSISQISSVSLDSAVS